MGCPASEHEPGVCFSIPFFFNLSILFVGLARVCYPPLHFSFLLTPAIDPGIIIIQFKKQIHGISNFSKMI